MQVTTVMTGDVVVVSPTGRLDSTSSGLFGVRLDEAAGQAANVLIDCESLEFVSSAGLRVLLALLKKLRTANKALALCNVRPPIREVIEITGFDRLLVAYPDRPAALAALVR